jgi:hypothetical protein
MNKRRWSDLAEGFDEEWLVEGADLGLERIARRRDRKTPGKLRKGSHGAGSERRTGKPNHDRELEGLGHPLLIRQRDEWR